MVIVQLKGEVGPGCAGGAEGWSRLTVSEFVFSCPCLQEAFRDCLSLPPGPPLCWWSWSSILDQSLTLKTPKESVLEGTIGSVGVWHGGKLRPGEGSDRSEVVWRV